MDRYPGMFPGAPGRDVEAGEEPPEYPPAVPSTSRGQYAGDGVKTSTGEVSRGGEGFSSFQRGVVSSPRKKRIGPSTTMSARKKRLRRMIERANTRRLGGDVRPNSAEVSPRSPRVARSPPANSRNRNDRSGAGAQREQPVVVQEAQGQVAPRGQGERVAGEVPRGHPARDLAGGVNPARAAGAIRQARGRSPRRRGPAVKFLQYFLAFLYYIGMSPVKPASAKRLPRIFRWIQAAFFWFGSLMAVLDAFADVKLGCIQFRLKENKETFVFLAFHLSNCLTRLYYIWLLAKSSESINDLLGKMQRVSPRGRSSGRWPMTIAVGVGLFSVLLAGACTLFGLVALNEWSFEETVYLQAYKYSKHLFLWSSDATLYDSITDKLWDRYAEEMTTETQVLAVVGNILSYFGTLHSCILLDLFLIVSIQISALERQLSKNMKVSSQNRPGVCPLSENWVEYKLLRDVCDQSDDIFGDLLEHVHTQNLLNFCYFLLQLLDKGAWNVYPFVDVVSVTKICITYYLAQKTAETNKKLEDCVTVLSGGDSVIIIGGEEQDVGILLDTMRKHPLGVGRGEFFIDKSFVRKFVGLVGTVFMLLAGNIIDKTSPQKCPDPLPIAKICRKICSIRGEFWND